MGMLLWIAGVLLAAYGVWMPADIGGTANLAMLNDKTNLVIAGAALFVGGVVLDAGTGIERAIHDAAKRTHRTHAQVDYEPTD